MTICYKNLCDDVTVVTKPLFTIILIIYGASEQLLVFSDFRNILLPASPQNAIFLNVKFVRQTHIYLNQPALDVQLHHLQSTPNCTTNDVTILQVL